MPLCHGRERDHLPYGILISSALKNLSLLAVYLSLWYEEEELFETHLLRKIWKP